MMIGANVPEEQVNSIADRTMREADKDGDGCITFAEFCHVSCRLRNGGGVKSKDAEYWITMIGYLLEE